MTYGFAEQLRKLADQIACNCTMHRKMKSDLYEIAIRAESLPTTTEHIKKNGVVKKCD